MRDPIKITVEPEITRDFAAIHPDPLIAREVVFEEISGRLCETRAALVRALELKPKTAPGWAIKRDIGMALSRTEQSRVLEHADPIIAAELAIGDVAGRLRDTRVALVRALDYDAGTPESLAIKRDIRSALFRTERSRAFAA